MRERNLQLDVLRCLAIVSVLMAHTVFFHQPRWWWDSLIVRPSWTGVDLFFVISGFLISGLLFSEFQRRGQINFRRFAIRRALKLYPTLYLLVFAVLLKRLIEARFHGVGPISSRQFTTFSSSKAICLAPTVTSGRFLWGSIFMFCCRWCSFSCFARRGRVTSTHFEAYPLFSCWWRFSA